MNAKIRHLFVGVVAILMLCAFFLSVSILILGEQVVMNRMQEGIAKESDMTIEQQYDDLVNKLLARPNDPNNVSSVLWPDRHKDYLFKEFVLLGKPIVPFLIEDLRAEKSLYLLPLLEEILPDVDLSKVHENQRNPNNTDESRECWLRWWSEEGSRIDWSKQ